MRAAETIEFEFEGHNLRCLTFVANCTVCGHRWVDPMYQEENLKLVEQARQAAARRTAKPSERYEQNLLEHCAEQPAQFRQAGEQGSG
jgi:hypothetical protein